MAQSSKPKAKKKLPRGTLEKNDRDLMEAIFGKRIMKKVDAVLDSQKTGSDGTR